MVYGVTWGEGDGPGGSAAGSAIVKSATTDIIADSLGDNFQTTVSLTSEITGVQVGDAVRVTARGLVSTFGLAGTIEVALGPTGLTTGSQLIAANLVDRGWWLEAVMINLSTGSNCQGHFALSGSGRLWEAMDMESGANSAIRVDSGSVQVSVNWGTADPANSITLRQLVVEKVTNG